MFSQGGSLPPSMYADARYIDDVIVLQASVSDNSVTPHHTLPTENMLEEIAGVLRPVDSPPLERSNPTCDLSIWQPAALAFC